VSDELKSKSEALEKISKDCPGLREQSSVIRGHDASEIDILKAQTRENVTPRKLDDGGEVLATVLFAVFIDSSYPDNATKS